MIISISGMPGSGKSTVGKMLAQKLGYKFYSIGDLRGKMALDRGITISQLNEIGKNEEWTDKEVDEYQKELAAKESNFVVDGRISFHFIPQSFKIFLDVDNQEAAKRIFANPRPDEEKADSAEEVAEKLQERVAQDEFRYRKYYNISFTNKNSFDLVIDTTTLGTEEIVDKIIKGMVEYESRK